MAQQQILVFATLAGQYPPYLNAFKSFFLPKKSDITLEYSLNKTLAHQVEQKSGRQTIYISRGMHTTYPSILHNCLPSPQKN